MTKHLDVARLVHIGLTDNQIAERLGLSHGGVRRHINTLGLLWSLDSHRNVRVLIAVHVERNNLVARSERAG